MNTDIKNFLLFSFLFFTHLVLLIVLAMKLWPGAEIVLFSEDGLLESASAAAYMLAAGLGFLAIHRGVHRGHDWHERMILMTVPWLALICGLDEISWGARLFDIEMPAMAGGGEFDGLHDIFILVERFVASLDPVKRGVIFVTFAMCFIFAAWRKRKGLMVSLEWLVDDHVRRCLGSAIVLLAVAVFLDFSHGRIISGLEEFVELSAGLYLAVAGLGSYRQSRSLPSASLNPARAA